MSFWLKPGPAYKSEIKKKEENQEAMINTYSARDMSTSLINTYSDRDMLTCLINTYSDRDMLTCLINT